MSRAGSAGALAAGAAFFIWGLFPLYWSQLGEVPAPQLLAHRALWCAIAVWVYLLCRRDSVWVRTLTARSLGLLAIGGVLISINWGVYVLAVTTGRVVDTSLGYFITPLVNVLVAVVVLRERLDSMQVAAVLIAALGVGYMAWQIGSLPWIALALAGSFGTYGLIRKLVPLDPVHSLAVESSVMLPPALLYLLWCEWQGQGHFLHGETLQDVLLITGGAVTAIPLVLFAYAAQRISMTVTGVLQYIAPSVALVIGVLVYHEPFGHTRQVAFGCIWLALALFTADALRRYRSRSGISS